MNGGAEIKEKNGEKAQKSNGGEMSVSSRRSWDSTKAPMKTEMDLHAQGSRGKI